MNSRSFLSIDPAQSSLKEVHQLLLSGVSPRPIALVSTISESGVDNLAPFSFFNAFGANPPYIAFSPAFSGRDGSAKDTLVNLQKIPECVVHAVSYDLVEQVSLASTAYDPDVSEFTKAGFESIDSDVVRPKRVKASPFQMECKVEQIIPLGGSKGSGNLVLCQVVKFHVASNIMVDGKLDPDRLDLMGRNGYNYYTRASGSALFRLDKPAGIGMGIDQLPQHIRESEILSGNDLGKLGSLSQLPDKHEVGQYVGALIASEAESEYHRAYLTAQDLLTSESGKTKQELEKVAKMALEQNDAVFAIHILMLLGNSKSESLGQV